MTDVPGNLQFAAVKAIYLEKVKDVGGVFQYPDGLTEGEWEALMAISDARARYEKENPPTAEK